MSIESKEITLQLSNHKIVRVAVAYGHGESLKWYSIMLGDSGFTQITEDEMRELISNLKDIID